MYDFPLDFSHSFRITLTSKFESIWPFQSNAIYNCDSLSQHSLLLLLLLHAPWLLTATHVANEPKMQSQHCVCVWLSMYVLLCVCKLATAEELHPLPLAWIFCPQLDGLSVWACCATTNRNPLPHASPVTAYQNHE